MFTTLLTALAAIVIGYLIYLLVGLFVSGIFLQAAGIVILLIVLVYIFRSLGVGI